MKKRLLILLFLFISLSGAMAQTRAVRGYLMSYKVEEGDTIFMDVLEPAWCFPRGRKMKKGDWRKEYRLVYNFNKVYPYALAARRMIRQIDSTIARDVTKQSQRRKYIHDVEKELFRLFEKDIRKTTISQGVLLMRLMDRECGMNGYDIIKTYESGFAANFWQLVARMFSQDLKSKYDPRGKDARTEQLIQIWESGYWDSFYYSIFMERPVKVHLEEIRLQTEVKKK